MSTLPRKRFWIIDQESPEDTDCNTVDGPFDTLREARRHLVKSTAELFASSTPDLREGPADEWSSLKIIVQEVQILRPEPRAKVTVRLRKL